MDGLRGSGLRSTEGDHLWQEGDEQTGAYGAPQRSPVDPERPCLAHGHDTVLAPGELGERSEGGGHRRMQRPVRSRPQRAIVPGARFVDRSDFPTVGSVRDRVLVRWRDPRGRVVGSSREGPRGRTAALEPSAPAVAVVPGTPPPDHRGGQPLARRPTTKWERNQ